MGAKLSKKGKYDAMKTRKKKNASNFIFKVHHERNHFLYDENTSNLDRITSLTMPNLTELRDDSWGRRRVDPKTRFTVDGSKMYSEASMRSEDYETISASLHYLPTYADEDNGYEEVQDNRDSEEVSNTEISRDLDDTIADIDIDEVVQKLKHIKRRIKLFDGKENYKVIIDDLDQCAEELNAVDTTTDLSRELVIHLNRKIKHFKQAIIEKQQKLAPVKIHVVDVSEDQSKIHFQSVVKLFAEVTNKLDDIKEEILNYYGTSEDAEYTTIMKKLNNLDFVIKEVEPRSNVNIVLTKEQYEDYINRLKKQFEVIVEESEKSFKLQKHTLSTMDRNRDRRRRSQILENNINIKEVHGRLSVDHTSIYKPSRLSNASTAVIEEEQDIYVSDVNTVKSEEQLYVSEPEIKPKLDDDTSQELYSQVKKVYDSQVIYDKKVQDPVKKGSYEDDAEFEMMLRKKESTSKPISPVSKNFQRQISASTEADDEFFDCEEFLETSEFPASETFNEFNNYSQVGENIYKPVELNHTNAHLVERNMSFIDDSQENIDEEKPSFKSIFGRSFSNKSNKSDEDSNSKNFPNGDGSENLNQVEYVEKNKHENSDNLQSNKESVIRPTSITNSDRSSTQLEYTSDAEEHEKLKAIHNEKRKLHRESSTVEEDIEDIQNYIKNLKTNENSSENSGVTKSINEPRKVSRITMKYIDELKQDYAQQLRELSPALDSEDEGDAFNFVEVVNKSIEQDRSQVGNNIGGIVDAAVDKPIEIHKFDDNLQNQRIVVNNKEHLGLIGRFEVTEKEDSNHKRIEENCNNYNSDRIPTEQNNHRDIEDSWISKEDMSTHRNLKVNDDQDFASVSDSDEYFEDIDLQENPMIEKHTNSQNEVDNIAGTENIKKHFEDSTETTSFDYTEELAKPLKHIIATEVSKTSDGENKSRQEINEISEKQSDYKEDSKHFEDSKQTSSFDHTEKLAKPLKDLIVTQVSKTSDDENKSRQEIYQISGNQSDYKEDLKHFENSNHTEELANPLKDLTATEVSKTSDDENKSRQEIIDTGNKYDDKDSYPSEVCMRSKAGRSTTTEESKDKRASVISLITDDEIKAVAESDLFEEDRLFRKFSIIKSADENDRRCKKENTTEFKDYTPQIEYYTDNFNQKSDDGLMNHTTDNIIEKPQEIEQVFKKCFDNSRTSNSKQSIEGIAIRNNISELMATTTQKENETNPTSNALLLDSLDGDINRSPFVSQSVDCDVFDKNEISLMDSTSIEFYEYFEKRKPPSAEPPKTPRNSFEDSPDNPYNSIFGKHADPSVSQELINKSKEDLNTPSKKCEDLNPFRENCVDNGFQDKITTPDKFKDLVTIQDFKENSGELITLEECFVRDSNSYGEYPKINDTPKKSFENINTPRTNVDNNNFLNSTFSDLENFNIFDVQTRSPYLGLDSLIHDQSSHDEIDSQETYLDVIHEDNLKHSTSEESLKQNNTQLLNQKSIDSYSVDEVKPQSIITDHKLEDLLRDRIIKKEQPVQVSDVPINPFIALVDAGNADSNRNNPSNSKRDWSVFDQDVRTKVSIQKLENERTRGVTTENDLNLQTSERLSSLSKNEEDSKSIQHTIDDSKLRFDTTDNEEKISMEDQGQPNFVQKSKLVNSSNQNHLQESTNPKENDSKNAGLQFETTVAKNINLPGQTECTDSSLDFFDEERDVISELPSLSYRSYLSDDDADEIETKLRTVKECMEDISICIRCFEGTKNDEEYDNIYENLFSAMSILNKIKSSDWEVIQEKQNILQEINKCMNDLEAMTG